MTAESARLVVREQGHTYDDYAAIPESDGRFELLDGELWALSAPQMKHQAVSTQLQKVLYECDEEYWVFNAPIDLILSNHTTLQPDVVLVRRNRLNIIRERGIEGPPDLVVEILSPSTAQRDRGRKMDLYTHYGVPEYWMVDPDNEQLEQYVLESGALALRHVYVGQEPVTSDLIACVHFTIASVMKRIPKLYP